MGGMGSKGVLNPNPNDFGQDENGWFRVGGERKTIVRNKIVDPEEGGRLKQPSILGGYDSGQSGRSGSLLIDPEAHWESMFKQRRDGSSFLSAPETPPNARNDDGLSPLGLPASVPKAAASEGVPFIQRPIRMDAAPGVPFIQGPIQVETAPPAPKKSSRQFYVHPPQPAPYPGAVKPLPLRSVGSGAQPSSSQGSSPQTPGRVGTMPTAREATAGSMSPPQRPAQERDWRDSMIPPPTAPAGTRLRYPPEYGRESSFIQEPLAREIEIPEPDFEAWRRERPILERLDRAQEQRQWREYQEQRQERWRQHRQQEQARDQREWARRRSEWTPDEIPQAVPESYQGPPLMLPLRKYDWLSSEYNPQRPHPVYKGQVRPHLAIDMAAKKGEPVYPVADGTVHKIIPLNGDAGNMVVIDHGNNYYSTYMHLNNFAAGLKKGDYVSQQQEIGAVGNTGTGTGPHLHFKLEGADGAIDAERLFGVQIKEGPGVLKRRQKP